MRNKTSLPAVFFAIATILCPADSPAQESAASVADRFLAGLASIEASERDSVLADLRWNATSFEYPGLVTGEDLFEQTFETDIEGVMGYERLVQLTVYLRPEVRLDKVYRLVAYPDRRTGKWKVWAFGEWDGGEADPVSWPGELPRGESEDAARLAVAYHLSLSGRLAEASAICDQLAAAEKRDPRADPLDAQIAATVRDLRKIIGR